MPVSQKNGYFDNSIFRRTYAISVGFKMKPLRKSIFPVLRQNPTQILLQYMLKGATVHVVSI